MTGFEFPGEARYVATAPLVMVKVPGAYKMVYDGGLIPASVDPAQRDHLLEGGMIALRSDAPPDELEAAAALDYEDLSDANAKRARKSVPQPTKSGL